MPLCNERRRPSLLQRWVKVLFLMVAVSASLSGVFACIPETPPVSTTPRLLLTPFRGRSFGTSNQVPVLVAAEITGEIRGRQCLLIQVDYTTTASIQLRQSKGSVIFESDPDSSDAVLKKYEQCRNEKRPCLIGLMDKNRAELIVQVELLSPTAGGLVIGGLYAGDCSADDTFDPQNIVANAALAVGLEFRRNNSEPAKTAEPDSSAEKTSSDAGTSDAGSSDTKTSD